jgi:hypothetical protein
MKQLHSYQLQALHGGRPLDLRIIFRKEAERAAERFKKLKHKAKYQESFLN